MVRSHEDDIGDEDGLSDEVVKLVLDRRDEPATQCWGDGRNGAARQRAYK